MVIGNRMEMRRNGNVTVPIFFEMVLVHISYSLYELVS